MDILISPAPLSGRIRAIPSKSDAHRLLILSALSDTKTELMLPSLCEDTEATMQCLTALGAEIHACSDGKYEVIPIRKVPPSPLLHCRESGSTLRFLLPIAAALADAVRFTGCGRLPERPLSPLREELEQNGCRFSEKKLPFTVSGRLCGKKFSLPGNVSSQFLSGILMALPLLGGGELTVTSEIESEPYLNMTIAAMERFHVSVLRAGNAFSVPEVAHYRTPGRISAEGDWSNAAFFLTAGALGNGACVFGLKPDSPQGDREIVSILSRMGAKIEVGGDSVTVAKSELHGTEIDAREIPDLVPILAVAAGAARGVTRIFHAERLRLKESNRLSATKELLSSLGVNARETEDGLLIEGRGGFSGGTCSSFLDHRIAMSAAVAAQVATGPVTISDAECIAKSYPRFLEDFQSLGGNVNVL